MNKNLELLGLSQKETKDLYRNLGRFRQYTGISIEFTEIEGSIIKISVQQKNVNGGYVLNRREIIERIRESKTLKIINEKFTVRYKISVFKPELNHITKKWIKDKMKKFYLRQVDVCLNLNLDKGTLSEILSDTSTRKLTRFQKSAFYFYFLNFEINRDLRKYIEELEKER